MAKSKKPKVTRNHTNDLRSARRMLTELRAYSGDFASAKLTQGALTLEVTFKTAVGAVERLPGGGAIQKLADVTIKRRPTAPTQVDAIESLSRPTPYFDFEDN